MNVDVWNTVHSGKRLLSLSSSGLVWSGLLATPGIQIDEQWWKRAAVFLQRFLPAASLTSTIFKTGPWISRAIFFPFGTFCTVAHWTGRQVRFVLSFFWVFVGRETGQKVWACAADLLFIRRVLLSQELLCNSFDGGRVYFWVADRFVKVWRVRTFLSFYLLISPPPPPSLLCESSKATYLMSR